MELFQDQRVYLQQSVNSCRLPVSLKLSQCRETELCGIWNVIGSSLSLPGFFSSVQFAYCAVYQYSPIVNEDVPIKENG